MTYPTPDPASGLDEEARDRLLVPATVGGALSAALQAGSFDPRYVAGARDGFLFALRVLLEGAADERCPDADTSAGCGHANEWQCAAVHLAGRVEWRSEADGVELADLIQDSVPY